MEAHQGGKNSTEVGDGETFGPSTSSWFIDCRILKGGGVSKRDFWESSLSFFLMVFDSIFFGKCVTKSLYMSDRQNSNNKMRFRVRLPYPDPLSKCMRKAFSKLEFIECYFKAPYESQPNADPIKNGFCTFRQPPFRKLIRHLSSPYQRRAHRLGRMGSGKTAAGSSEGSEPPEARGSIKVCRG